MKPGWPTLNRLKFLAVRLYFRYIPFCETGNLYMLFFGRLSVFFRAN
jgi:hypothetical protein